MSAAQKPEPGTALAKEDKKKALSPETQAKLDEIRLRNAVATQIRGAVWSKDLSAGQINAIAQYCRENGLDAVRHVEVLGGKLYLLASFYDERGAPLIRDGVIIPEEPDFINADPRLTELGKMGDSWAAAEDLRRKRERIRWNVPEKAAAAVVQRFIIAATGRPIYGVNWCGGGSRQRDPVGDTEPTKTALTRARRRAWQQIADVVPQYASIVRPLEERAKMVAPILTVEQPDSTTAKRLPQPVIMNLGYETDAPRVVDEAGRPEIRETVADADGAESQRSVSEAEDLDAIRREVAAIAEEEQESMPLGDTPRRGRGTRIED